MRRLVVLVALALPACATTAGTGLNSPCGAASPFVLADGCSATVLNTWSANPAPVAVRRYFEPPRSPVRVPVYIPPEGRSGFDSEGHRYTDYPADGGPRCQTIVRGYGRLCDDGSSVGSDLPGNGLPDRK